MNLALTLAIGLSCRVLATAALALAALGAQADSDGVNTRSADTYHSDWEFSEETRRCRLLHRVPRFGKVVFDQRGDSSLILQLQSELPLADMPVTVSATAPGWRRDLETFEIERVDAPRESHTVTLMGKNAERAYQAMQDGYDLGVTLGVVEGALSLTANVTGFNLRAQGFHDCQTRASSAAREYRANVAAETAARLAAAELTRVPVAPATAALKGKPDSQPQTAPAIALIREAIVNTTDADRVFFAPGEDQLNAESKALLARHIAAWRSGTRPTRVHLHGHADGVGAAYKNFLLSKRRAESVARFLRDAVPGLNVVVHPHGENMPLVLAAGAHERNRRVEVIPENRDGWQ